MSVVRLQSLITKTGTSTASILSKGASAAEVQLNAVLEQNAQYIVRDPKAEDLLFRQFVFTKLSKLPGIFRGATQEAHEVPKIWAKSGDYTVRDAAIGALFCGEVYAWFCFGEIIGRGGTIMGYYF